MGDPQPPGDALLELRGLAVRFSTPAGPLPAVNGVDLSVRPGETLGVVGESGSGKSATCLSVLGLHPPGTEIGGQILFRGRDLSRASDRELRRVRGKEIGLVYQDPMAALNPVRTVGAQLREPLTLHLGLRRAQADERAVGLLARVGIPDAPRALRAYPHEFSGGMRQRILIAMAVAAEPALLLADEPTTALDVSVQAQVLELLRGLTQELGIAMVLVSHDLAVVAGIADRVAVMYAGRVVENAPAGLIFAAPRHPYTAALLESVAETSANAVEISADQDLPTIPGAPPDLRRLPAGCSFAPRCGLVTEACRTRRPDLAGEPGTGLVACWVADKQAIALPTPNTVANGGGYDA